LYTSQGTEPIARTGKRRIAYKVLVEENLKEIDNCEDVDVDGEVIFK
jgi:hypothetical protein